MTARAAQEIPKFAAPNYLVGNRRSVQPLSLGDRGRGTIAEMASIIGHRLQVPHGLVIATTIGRPHLLGCRNIGTKGRGGVNREFRMALGQGYRSKDRSASAGAETAAPRSRFEQRQEIVKTRGATLAGIADRNPRIYGIVVNAMTFDVGASPREIGRACDLAIALPNRWRSTFSARFLATQSSDRPKPVRRPRCALVTQAFTAEFDYAVF
jgi:hypothetical protein